MGYVCVAQQAERLSNVAEKERVRDPSHTPFSTNNPLPTQLGACNPTQAPSLGVVFERVSLKVREINNLTLFQFTSDMTYIRKNQSEQWRSSLFLDNYVSL